MSGQSAQTASAAPTQAVVNPALVIQPKLTMGAAGDRFEREADDMADAIAATGFSMLPSDPTDDDSPDEPIEPTGTPSRQVQAKSLASGRPKSAPTSVPHGVPEHVASSHTRGQPLPASSRTVLEHHLRRDLSGVRVHTDDRSAEIAQQLRARAFTVGNHIFFGRDQYRPSTSTGQRLLAHETTHVVQQGAAGSLTQPRSLAAPHVSTAATSLQRDAFNDALGGYEEQEAERQIDTVLGEGAYDEWLTFETRWEIEHKRANVNRVRFKDFKSSTNAAVFEADADRLDQVAADYRQLMVDVLNGTPVDEDHFIDVGEVYGVSLELVELDNDALDGVFFVALGTAFALMPWALLLEHLQMLDKAIVKLEKALREANIDALEASGKAALSLALNAVTFFAPQVGLFTRIVMGVGQVTLDFMFEGPDQHLVLEAGGKAAPLAEQGADLIVDMKKVGEKARGAAGKARGGAVVVGMLASGAEVWTAFDNIDEIKNALVAARAAHKKTVKTLDKHGPKFVGVLQKFDEAQGKIQEVWKQAKDMRHEVLDAMASTGYDP